MHLAEADNRLVVHRIAEAWAEGNEAPSQPDETKWRGSWAGMCARKIAYMVADVPETNPSSTADIWRMGLGSVVHELLQPAIEQWIGSDTTLNAEEEVNVVLGEHGHGHVDLVLETDDGKTVVVELKTINGFGYKMAIEKGEGPRHSAVLQGSMYARALNADYLVLAYLSLENIAPGRAEKFGLDDIGRFAAEWHLTPDEFFPLAEQEMERIEGIALATEAEGPQSIPRRFSHSDPDVPFPAEIDDPSKGLWVEGTSYGKVWQCNYCNHQDQCVQDKANGF